MINDNDPSLWALDRVIRACEERRLDPPDERLIACHFCGATGSLGDYDCDACDATGYMSEPEEYKDDAYWQSKLDERRGK